MNKPIIKYLTKSDFEKFKLNLAKFHDFSTSEKYGLTITVGDKVYILLCDDPSLTKTQKDIVFWHEKAHASGIDDEEEADRWAMDRLNGTAQDELINNWKHRHGHAF